MELVNNARSALGPLRKLELPRKLKHTRIERKLSEHDS